MAASGRLCFFIPENPNLWLVKRKDPLKRQFMTSNTSV